MRSAALQIIKYCEKDNISKVYSCITRLRLNFKDKEIVDYDALKAMDLVKGIFWYGEECQLVIGLEAMTLSKVMNDLLFVS